MTASVTVTNTGAAPCKYAVGFSIRNKSSGEVFDGEWAAISVPSVPGENEVVYLYLSVPSDAPIGDYEAILRSWSSWIPGIQIDVRQILSKSFYVYAPSTGTLADVISEQLSDLQIQAPTVQASIISFHLYKV